MTFSKFHNTGTSLHWSVFIHGIEAKNKAMSPPTAKCEKSDCHLLSSKIVYNDKDMTKNLSEPVDILSESVLIISSVARYSILK